MYVFVNKNISTFWLKKCFIWIYDNIGVICPFQHYLSHKDTMVNVLKFKTLYSIFFGLNFAIYAVFFYHTTWNGKQCRHSGAV